MPRFHVDRNELTRTEFGKESENIECESHACENREGSTVDLNPRDETFMEKDRASCCVLNVHTIQPSTNETELE